MKNKLGIISGLILSLAIAGSVFAGTSGTSLKTTGNSVAGKIMKVKNTKPKKHRKHKKLKRKITKKVAAKTAAPNN